MKKIFLITMFITMLFMTTACDAVISLAEKSLYDVILDDIYTFYDADDGVSWMGFSVYPEGEMSKEYFAEVMENGMLEVAEKYLKKATADVKVLHMNKTDAKFNETERYIAVYGPMLGGKMGDVIVTVYELNDNQVYIRYHADIDDESIIKNVVYDLVK